MEVLVALAVGTTVAFLAYNPYPSPLYRRLPFFWPALLAAGALVLIQDNPTQGWNYLLSSLGVYYLIREVLVLVVPPFRVERASLKLSGAIFLGISTAFFVWALFAGSADGVEEVARACAAPLGVGRVGVKTLKDAQYINMMNKSRQKASLARHERVVKATEENTKALLAHTEALKNPVVPPEVKENTSALLAYTEVIKNTPSMTTADIVGIGLSTFTLVAAVVSTAGLITGKFAAAAAVCWCLPKSSDLAKVVGSFCLVIFPKGFDCCFLVRFVRRSLSWVGPASHRHYSPRYPSPPGTAGLVGSTPGRMGGFCGVVFSGLV